MAETVDAAAAKTPPPTPARPARARPKKATFQSNTRSLTADEVLAAFREPVRRRGVSIPYLIGLMVVATTMVILPLLYLALIALIGAGIVYHVREHTWIMNEGRLGSVYVVIARFLAYTAPIVIGAAMILFMLKPLFARWRDDSEPLTLDRSQEPTLYALIDRLCDELGASRPRQIVVDGNINASAGFRRGFLSFFGSDMVLTIGLPYVAGLTVEQFVSVLSHELGHFSQGLAMRLGYVINRTNNWFARVVYERDHWDEQLEDLSKNEDGRVAILFLMTRGCIWLSRRALWLLMHLGHFVSCGMSRQMEYDADRRAADVVGRSVTHSEVLQLHFLQVGWQLVQSDLNRSWRENRLPDNLPAMIAARASQLSKDARGELESVFLKTERGGWFSTHPSMRAQFANLQKCPAEGVFACDAPATALFANFKMVAHAVTLTYYRSVVGLPVSSQNLVKSEELAAKHDEQAEESRVLRRYFQRCFSVYRPMLVEMEFLKAPSKPREALTMLRDARTRFERSWVGHAEHYKALGDAATYITNLRRAHAFFRAGYKKIDKTSFRVREGTRDEVEAAIVLRTREMGDKSRQVDAMNRLLQTRMKLALRLLAVPEVRAKFPDGEKRLEELNTLLPALFKIESTFTKCIEIRDENELLEALLNCMYSHETEDELPPTIRGAISTTETPVRMKLDDVLFTLDEVPYPFEHAEAHTRISKYLAPHRPIGPKPEEVCMAASEAIDRMRTLHARILARMAATAELVERIAGFKPMAEPDDAPPASATIGDGAE